MPDASPAAAPEAPPVVARPRPRRRRVFLFGALAGVLLLVIVRYVINETAWADRIVAPLVLRDTPGDADVIVVIAAGVFRGCEPNHNAIRRTLLGVRLWRERRAPLVLFNGGQATGDPCLVGPVMAKFAREIGLPDSVIRVEQQSRSTHENAEMSLPLLREMGARRLLVVTDRLHMTRAAGAFERYGYTVLRASVPVYQGHPDNVSMLEAGLREYAALAYYRYHGWLPGRDATAVAAGRSPFPAERAVAAPAAPMTLTNPSGPLVVLGASYAEGWKLPAIAGRQVVNVGREGQQSFQLLERFAQDVVPHKPRAVVIWGFINDVFRTSRDKVGDNLERTRRSYVEMIAAARAAGIEPILATEITVPVVMKWSQVPMQLLGAAMGKESYQSWVNRHVLGTDLWLEELAKAEGLQVLDFQRALAKADGSRRAEFATPDGSHISAAGYAALTAYATPRLERHLSGQPAAGPR
jgi:uncharacterized SAM-binding protein YcdF (DUF218 family)/lysophospholipase L1-like esterase